MERRNSLIHVAGSLIPGRCSGRQILHVLLWLAGVALGFNSNMWFGSGAQFIWAMVRRGTAKWISDYVVLKHKQFYTKPDIKEWGPGAEWGMLPITNLLCKQLCLHPPVTCKSLQKKRLHLHLVKCLNKHLIKSMFSRSFESAVWEITKRKVFIFTVPLNAVFQVLSILSKHIQR